MPAALARELAAIRKRGWVSHQTPGGITGVAFSIAPAAGRATAALGLFLPAFRYKGEHRRAILARMKETAAALSRIWPE